MKTIVKALSVSLVTAFASQAEIRLPDIVGPGMVVQQVSDARLGGWATPEAR